MVRPASPDRDRDRDVSFLCQPKQEDSFHATLLAYFEHFGHHADNDLASYANLMGKYCQLSQLKYDELTSPRQRLLASSSSAQTTNALEMRAERDLWSLLFMMSGADVLGDMSADQQTARLQAALEGMPVMATIPDYINTAYMVDDRLKKSAILKDWVEQAASDQVRAVPTSVHEPWADTLDLLTHTTVNTRTNKTQLQSIHPDAQVMDGKVLPLIGVDRADQEALLNYIFQLIRAGQMRTAQEVAHQHKVYWLAASLRGIASHCYEQIEHMDRDEQIVRIGNIRQPLFVRTCWRYSEKLAGNNANWDLPTANAYSRLDALGSKPLAGGHTSAGLLEMTIYSALANHTKVLSQSPLLTTWHDKLWVYLKGCHDRDIARVVQAYRTAKAAHSAFYTGCDESTLNVEEEVLALYAETLGTKSVVDCTDILKEAAPPSGRNLLCLLYQLQAAAMGGRSALQVFLEEVVRPLSDQPLAVWRVLVHMLLWMTYCPRDCSSSLHSVVPPDLLFLIIERYIDALIDQSDYHLVALYAVYLPRGMRIRKYGYLLYRIQAAQADGVRALELAQEYFPEDVLEITRAVVDRSPEEVPEASSAVPRIMPALPSLAAPASNELVFLDKVNHTLSADAKARIESLQWFVLNASAPSEAIRQINRQILQCILPAGPAAAAPSLVLVLDEYVPKSLVIDGYAHMAVEQKERLEEIKMKAYSRHVQGEGGLSADDKHVINHMNLSASSWTSDVAKLSFWRRLSVTLATYDAFVQQHEEFLLQTAKLLGSPALQTASLAKYQTSLQHRASEVLGAVRQLLTTNPLMDVDEANTDEMIGYEALWATSRDVHISSIRHGLMAAQEACNQPTARQHDQQVIDEINTARQQVLVELDANRLTIIEAQELVQLSDRLAYADADGLVTVLSHLKQCAHSLADLQAEQDIQCKLLAFLLKAYAQVCLSTADAMRTIDANALELASGWYQEVILLTTLIASDEFSLQFYTILRRYLPLLFTLCYVR